MDNIIKEFYYGNLIPSDMQTHDPEVHALIQIVNNNEEKLLQSLDGELKDCFIELMDAQSQINALLSADNFEQGFRLGARFQNAIYVK